MDSYIEGLHFCPDMYLFTYFYFTYQIVIIWISPQALLFVSNYLLL